MNLSFSPVFAAANVAAVGVATVRMLFGVLLMALLFSANAAAEWQFGMQEPATKVAEVQQWLNEFIMWIIVVIGIGVFGVMFYSIIHHRKDKGFKAAHFHENTLVEVIWTAVPVLIIIGMALPATSAIINIKDTSSPDLTVKVTGFQWKWSYDYLDQDVFFYSQLSTPPEELGGKYYGTDAPANPQSENYLLEVDNEMVVPVGKRVRLLLTAADVIHAWWVPQLGVKQDAIPGVVRDAWFQAEKPGVYRGQCAELCGKNHGYMPIVVRAVPEEEFDEWLTAQGGTGGAAADSAADENAPVYVGAAAVADSSTAEDAAPVEWTMETAMEKGEGVYNTYCAACHQTNGQGLAPAFPGLIGTPIVTGDVAAHIDIVVNGKPGTAMAAFSYLSAEDLAAVITYERNAWGNDTGDLVKPEDVK